MATRGAPDTEFIGLDEEAALRSVLEGTATETGERFFTALVDALASALGTDGAWVTELLPDGRHLRALAFRMGDRWIDDYEYDVVGTPCEVVVAQRRLVHYPENIVELFPEDPDLEEFHAVSFMGAPLLDAEGRVLGHLAVLDSRPLPQDPRALALMRIFAARAGAELLRLSAESEVRQRESRLRGLIDGAMDAILELDEKLSVRLVNPAAEGTFGASAADLVGRDAGALFSEASREKLERLAGELTSLPAGERSLWIADGLEAVTLSGERFPAEATISPSGAGHTLILRNVNDREEAQRRIRSLTSEAQSLREELRQLQGAGDLLGRSEPIRRLLHDLDQVAPTDSTVLVVGETGTGKELVARAIHERSERRRARLVKVNCAAIPGNLMESEFFGHEKGAFTGATSRREGRFAQAHGGTLFLDEVGELPLDLQAKLLRVLQEGEFEPVGGPRTLRVDVRVIAATNRNLEALVREGSFREDLYYRLAVFPLHVPALRERKQDIPLLAGAFAERLAQRLGRPLQPLGDTVLARLSAYDWPGNVRELQNVIERALITAHDGRLDLDRALPETAPAAAAADAREAPGRIYTAAELQALERENLLRALEACGWKVSGEQGAAQRLGVKPTTLSSRMKALGIERHR
jgi:PAS domain S-box-containing protein